LNLKRLSDLEHASLVAHKHISQAAGVQRFLSLEKMAFFKFYKYSFIYNREGGGMVVHACNSNTLEAEAGR
jgi:hypothetical protein